MGHDCPGANEAVTPECQTADHGCVGADAGSPHDQCSFVFVLPWHAAARVYYVGKHCRGSAKDVILEDDSRVDGDIILNFYVVADDAARRDDYVLAHIAVFSNHGSLHDVAEMPNLCSLADGAGFVYERGFVDEIMLFLAQVRAV